MKKNLKTKAKEVLGEVRPDWSFWMTNGQILKNLEEFSEALKNIDVKTFKYHVNKEKHDFAIWVKEVINDKDLAKTLGKNRKTMSDKVKKRLSYWKRKVK